MDYALGDEWTARMPRRVKRALECLKGRMAGRPGPVKRMPRSALPQMVAPEREWQLLRAVQRAAMEYRRAQRALAEHEAVGGGEAVFEALLGRLTLSHRQLDAALSEIQRYDEEAGAPAA